MAALTRGRPWLDALAVVVAALILFAFTMPHTVTFEDAGLFDSVCYTGGIAHPPGYPLFTLMCTPLFQLPLEPAIIGNSMSALFGALTCGLLVLVLDRLGVIRLVSITGGLLLAVSDTFWSQSIIVEVYTLNTLLVLGVLYFSLCFREAPSRCLAWTTTLVFSLSIANHWPLTVLALPGLLAVCLSRLDWILEQRRNPVFWAGLVGSALLGISPYFTLLLKHHLIVSFSGPVDGPKALWDYFMRRAYTHVDSQAAANITDKWHYILWFIRRMPHEISLVLLPFAALGVLAGHKRLGWPVQVGIGLIFLGGSLGLILLLGYEYEYPHEISLRPFLLVG
ncbi:MAG TPA: DUF2723 domain-containing protein, partial [Pseudomonadales bacterium]|nr:DUF2723 domain-containing protein [Pseudomonadales bacterium]